MSWTTYTQLAFRRQVEGRVLVVSFELNSLTLIALETIVGAEDSGSYTAIERVLAHHGHRLLGAMPSLPAAIAAAERFAVEWASGEPLEQCRCTWEDLNPS